jgi:DNA-binding NarL/FixJ family response regulator
MIVDDQEDVRTLLRMMIELANDGLVVGCEAESGTEALDKIDHCDPVVVVLDEMMPGMNGIETAERMLAKRPEQRVILCTAYLDEEITRRGEATGVRAFVHKDDIRTIPDVIREVVGA